MIVSMVGKFTGQAADGSVNFQCSDGGTVRLSTEHAELPQLDMMDGPAFEAIGQVMDGSFVTVSSEKRRREVSLSLPLHCTFQPRVWFSILLHPFSFLALCGSRAFEGYGYGDL